LIVDRGGWASEIVDFIDFNVEGVGDVVSKQLKVPVVQQVLDVASSSSVKVIDAQNLIPPRE